MTRLFDPSALAEHVRDLIGRFDAPGASVAIARGGEIVEAVAGVANAMTGAVTTPDTRFQIGSTSKVYTGTLVMRAFDEGKIELDVPVRTYIPGLRFADDEATETITIRQLLSHTSGLEGDFYEDTGRGDDAIALYVEACKELPSLCAPGILNSYSNAGYVVLGRLIEFVFDMTYERALRELLLEPAGLGDVALRAEEAILGPTAVGHATDPHTRELSVVPRWMLPWCMAPAGSIINSTARSLARFGVLHMSDHAALGLSPETTRLMRDVQVDLPDRRTIAARAWALPWIVFEWNGTQVFGHDGGTFGQSSLLRIIPEHDVVIAALANGGRGTEMNQRFAADIAADLCGVGVPAPLEPSDEALDLQRYVGKWGRFEVSLEILEEGGALAVQARPSGRLATMTGPVDGALRPGDGDTLLLEAGSSRVPMTFVDLDGDGRPEWVFSLFRAHRRFA